MVSRGTSRLASPLKPRAAIMTRRRAACPTERRRERAMANAESEPDLIPAAREPPPRALTRLSPLVRRIVAPNASPFTFNGTCTYIVGEGAVAIVDPGPDDDSHLAALLAAVEGEQVETVLVTHTHRDHSVGAKRLSAATGARIVGAAPFTPRADGTAGLDSSHDRDYSPDAILADGERLRGAATQSRRSPRPAIAPIICASRFPRKAPCSPAITSWLGRRRSSRPPTARCAPTWPRSTSCAGAARRSTGLVTAARSSNRSDICAR